MNSVEEVEAEVLTQIYAKQHIRRSGVLASEYDEPDGRRAVGRLEEAGYVVSDRFYRFDTIRCTDAGSKLASNRIREFF